MPHVIVKLWQQQKTRLAEAITKDVMEILHYGDEAVSVAMEEVKSNEWIVKVYQPDIKKKWDKLYKKTRVRRERPVRLKTRGTGPPARGRCPISANLRNRF
jgi:4-oxalocrotonate tautomerase